MSEPLKVLSWNVLAQAYIGYLPHQAQIESAEKRYACVAAKINAWNPDIALLQEVDQDCLIHLYQHLSGFRIFYAQRPEGKPDGLATLIRSGLNVLSSRVRYFQDVGSNKKARLGQSTILDVDGRRLLVGNVHFAYDDAPHTRHEGIFEAKQYFGGLPLGVVDAAVIGGDWNAEIEHPLLQLALSYGFQDAIPQKKETCRANGRSWAVDHLIHQPCFQSEVWLQPSLEGNKVYPNTEFPSDHLPIGVRLSWKG